MSTLEHPEGEEPQQPDPDPGGAEADAPSAAEPEAPRVDVSPDEEAPVAVEQAPDEPDPDAGSTLERSGEDDDPLDRDEIVVDAKQVRRAPRYGRFATVGGLLGVVAGFVSAPFASYDEPGMVMDVWGLALLLAAILAPVGILLGLLLALLADRRSRRERPQ